MFEELLEVDCYGLMYKVIEPLNNRYSWQTTSQDSIHQILGNLGGLILR